MIPAPPTDCPFLMAPISLKYLPQFPFNVVNIQDMTQMLSKFYVFDVNNAFFLSRWCVILLWMEFIPVFRRFSDSTRKPTSR